MHSFLSIYCEFLHRTKEEEFDKNFIVATIICNSYITKGVKNLNYFIIPIFNSKGPEKNFLYFFHSKIFLRIQIINLISRYEKNVIKSLSRFLDLRNTIYSKNKLSPKFTTRN